MSKKTTVVTAELTSDGTILLLHKDLERFGTYLHESSLIAKVVGTGRVKVTVREGKITIEKIKKEKPCLL